MAAYYNEIDPFAAAWLRELIKARLIAPGDVDGRSIADIRPADLSGYTQCYFFAGIGGWSLALRLAGWPDDRAAWTGSCPCQPFSGAGKGGGFADERHLWPLWHWLIREHRPGVLFGEQVESPAARAWLDLVFTDLEADGYAGGAVDLPAASVGAPHIRQRLVWVADLSGEQRDSWRLSPEGDELGQVERPARFCSNGGLGHGHGHGQGLQERERDGGIQPQAVGGDAGQGAGRPIDLSGMVVRRESEWVESRRVGAAATRALDRAGATRGGWAGADWIYCRDEKFRPVEPGAFPLAHGVSGRVGRLRGYGNAIVPEKAAEVVRAYMEMTAVAPSV